MKLNESLVRILSLSLIFVFVFSTTAFADSSEYNNEKMTLAEAEEYLMNYEMAVIDSDGAEHKIKLSFTNDEKLKETANFIIKNGVEAFEEELNDGLVAVNIKSEKNKAPQKVIPSSIPVINKILKSNGIFPISGEYEGFVDFGRSTLEYVAKLSFKVTVKNKKITGINNIGFNMIDISALGSYNNVKIKTNVNDTKVGSVTATYDVSKSIMIPTKTGDVPVTDTKQESFAIMMTVSM